MWTSSAYECICAGNSFQNSSVCTVTIIQSTLVMFWCFVCVCVWLYYSLLEGKKKKKKTSLFFSKHRNTQGSGTAGKFIWCCEMLSGPCQGDPM